MKKARQKIVLICCGILLSARPVYAQWPVFDMGEIIPVVKDLKDEYSIFNGLVEKLEQQSGALSAIGKGPAFTNFLSPVSKESASGAADDLGSTVKDTEDDNIDDVVDDVDNQGEDTQDEVIDETSTGIDKIEGDLIKKDGNPIVDRNPTVDRNPRVDRNPIVDRDIKPIID